MILESDSGLNTGFENDDYNSIIYSVISMHQALSKAFINIVLFNPYNISIKKTLFSF